MNAIEEIQRQALKPDTPFSHGSTIATNKAAKNMNGQATKYLAFPFAILAIGNMMPISINDLVPAPIEVSMANASIIVITLGCSVTYGLTK